jgi:hypothetical protein
MQPICVKCGKNLALVGRVHNCTHTMANTQDVVANTASGMANVTPGTYKYRDAEKRRAYMREYMRGKRGRELH